MAGYCNFSMSNNAVAAYQGGERPISKWTKESILTYFNNDKTRKIFSELKVTDLKEILLEVSSWHHTSKNYNRTDFYSFWPDPDFAPETARKFVDDWKKYRNTEKQLSNNNAVAVYNGASYNVIISRLTNIIYSEDHALEKAVAAEKNKKELQGLTNNVSSDILSFLASDIEESKSYNVYKLGRKRIDTYKKNDLRLFYDEFNSCYIFQEWDGEAWQNLKSNSYLFDKNIYRVHEILTNKYYESIGISELKAYGIELNIDLSAIKRPELIYY